MNKSILIPIITCIVFIIVAAGSYFYFTNRPAPELQSAKQCEQSGDLQQALSLYCTVVFNGIPSFDKLDINQSKFLAPNLLKQDVGKYMTWITTPSKKVKPDITDALEGMTRCESQGRKDNTISEPVILPLTADHYLAEWNKTFFAPNIAIDPSHAALASGNYFHKLSLLIINSELDYTYEVNLINPSTHRGIKCVLLPENSVRLYALPGEHLLLCRSSVAFGTDEIWRSHYTPIRITIPPEPSLVTTELRTRIHRRMKQDPAAPIE